MSIALDVNSATVAYGDLVALRDVSIKIRPGEIVCVIGPNGAGKSTLMSAIAGGVPMKPGQVTIFGEDTKGRTPTQIAQLGASMVPEGRHAFNTLTVLDNLRVGGMLRGGSRQIAADIERVFALFPRLRERSNSLAGRLSGGEQQMLVVARALMTRPKLMMIDEPSLGLAPLITEQIYKTLLELRKEQGLTLMINEQSSDRVLKYADRIYVIRSGRIQLEGNSADLAGGVEIKRAYFGFDAQLEGAVK